MIRLSPILCCALLFGCAGIQTPGDVKSGPWVQNGCLVTAASKDAALASYERLHGQPIKRGILLMRFKGQNTGHAVCCFEWLGHRYVYDADWGSREFFAGWDNPVGIAAGLYDNVAGAAWLQPVLEPPANSPTE